MKQVTVTFTTNDTANDMSTVESEIIRVAEMNSGVETGSGFDPEGRDVCIEFSIHSEVKPFLKQLRSVMSKLKYRIPSLKVSFYSADSPS